MIDLLNILYVIYMLVRFTGDMPHYLLFRNLVINLLNTNMVLFDILG